MGVSMSELRDVFLPVAEHWITVSPNVVNNKTERNLMIRNLSEKNGHILY